MPMAFSSLSRGLNNGRIYSGSDYAVVLDQNPFCFAETEMFRRLCGAPPIPPEMMIKYTYSAALLYRKSRNPHGPSIRPIFVAALEHSMGSCNYESGGLMGWFGGERRPTEVVIGEFSPGGHTNRGHVENTFDDDSAAECLIGLAINFLGKPDIRFRLMRGFGPDEQALI